MRRVGLTSLARVGIVDVEAWTKDLDTLEDAHKATRDTLPPPEETPVLCPGGCGAPLTWDGLDGSTRYYACSCAPEAPRG